MQTTTVTIAPHATTPSFGEMSDEALLGFFIQTRNHAAFECIVDRQQAFTYRVAYGVAGNRAIAEDACQEAFVRLLHCTKEAADKVPNFRAWFYTIILHVTRNLLRTNRRRSQREVKKVGKPTEISQATNPIEQACLNAECQTHLREALSSMSEESRLPLTLQFLQGFSQEEIGALLGISQSQVSRRVTAGLMYLRKRMVASAVMLIALFKQKDEWTVPENLKESILQRCSNLIRNAPLTEPEPVVTRSRRGVFVFTVCLALTFGAACYLYGNRIRMNQTEAAVLKSRFRREWDFELPLNLDGLKLRQGHWKQVPGSGVDKSGGLQLQNMGTTVVQLPVTPEDLPIRIQLKWKEGNSSAFSNAVSWDHYDRVISIQNYKAQFFSRQPSVYHSLTYYVTEKEIVAEQAGATSYFAITPSAHAHLVMILNGQTYIDNLVCEPLKPEEIPEFTLFKVALRQVPAELKEGMQIIEGLPPEDKDKPVTAKVWPPGSPF